jgi:UDP-GlcNAc:undecaprenyl-phosphate GlcNAc-1-phosphate transferase
MWAFLSTAILAAAITPVIIKMYRHFNWLDDPTQDSHAKKTHSRPVPRGGGLVIFIAIIATSFFFLNVDHYLIHILVAAALLTLVGFLDDIYDLSPVLRLGTGLLASLIVVGSGIGIAYVSNPFTEGVIHLNYWQLPIQFLGETRNIWILSDLFAVIFMVWNMNIVNWSKGVDGQMPGFVSIALLFIGLLSYRFIDDPTQFNTANLSFIVAGAYAGFLVWNWYPQKIMPGYGGGSLAGFFLSVLAILSGAKLATTLMVLAIPTADAVFSIARRLRARKSPLWGDRGHLHHKLLDVFHWGKRRIAVFYWITSSTLGVLSLYLNTVGKLVTITVAALCVFAILIVAKYKSTKRP